jgi:hypothetical protein
MNCFDKIAIELQLNLRMTNKFFTTILTSYWPAKPFHCIMKKRLFSIWPCNSILSCNDRLQFIIFLHYDCYQKSCMSCKSYNSLYILVSFQGQTSSYTVEFLFVSLGSRQSPTIFFVITDSLNTNPEMTPSLQIVKFTKSFVRPLKTNI